MTELLFLSELSPSRNKMTKTHIKKEQFVHPQQVFNTFKYVKKSVVLYYCTSFNTKSKIYRIRRQHNTLHISNTFSSSHNLDYEIKSQKTDIFPKSERLNECMFTSTRRYLQETLCLSMCKILCSTCVVSFRVHFCITAVRVLASPA